MVTCELVFAYMLREKKESEVYRAGSIEAIDSRPRFNVSSKDGMVNSENKIHESV